MKKWWERIVVTIAFLCFCAGCLCLFAYYELGAPDKFLRMASMNFAHGAGIFFAVTRLKRT